MTHPIRVLMKIIPPLTMLVFFAALPTAAVRAAPADAPGSPDGPLDVGDRRQVFIDGRFLAESQNVERLVHQPRKTGEWTIKPEHPWEQGGIGPYSSVLHDGKTYHMWYHTMASVQWDIDKYAGSVCYATSADGIRWIKPTLGLAEFDGSRENNIVLGYGAGGVKIGQDGGMVFIDPNAPADERFRLVIRVDDLGEGVHAFSSPDGLHWRLTRRAVLHARPQEHGHHLDSQNVVFWDDRLNKYVAYGRKNLSGVGSQGRAVFRGEAPDLESFPAVQDLPAVLAPDRQDLFHGDTAVVDYYMSAAIKYAWAQDAYYMFPTAYYHYIPGVLREFGNEVPTNAGPLDTQFAASRDGIHWERFDRRPFVGLGMRSEFDWASARMIHGIVPDVAGREMYMYYRASDWLHGWDRDERNKRLLTAAGLGADRNIAVLSRVVLRRDGFVSVRAAYTGGEFTTPPLTFKGAALVLNVDTSATGIVRIGILDGKGLPMDGYGVEDCDRIHTANDVNRVVTWGGKSGVRPLAGRPVRLRFVMRDADLYAFQFRD